MRVELGDVAALRDDELALLRALRVREAGDHARQRGGGPGRRHLEHVTSGHLCHTHLLSGCRESHDVDRVAAIAPDGPIGIRNSRGPPRKVRQNVARRVTNTRQDRLATWERPRSPDASARPPFLALSPGFLSTGNTA